MWEIVLTVDADTDHSSETIGSRHITKNSAIRNLGDRMAGLMISEVPFFVDVEKSMVTWTSHGRKHVFTIRPSV